MAIGNLEMMFLRSFIEKDFSDEDIIDLLTKLTPEQRNSLDGKFKQIQSHMFDEEREDD